MNWFKENKFLGGLIVVTALIAGLLIFLGLSTATKRDEVVDQRAAQLSNITKMERMTPHPTIESVAEKKANLKKVIAAAETMQSHFNSYRPETLENITVSSFSDRLKNSEATVRAAFEEKGITIPDNAYLGFEQYKGSLPKDKATGVLSYQLSAIDWLFTTFAEANISEVVNFQREVLPPEDGKEWDEKPARSSKKKKKKSRGKGKSRSSAAALPTVPVAKRLPIEFTVKGSESAIRKVIESIANSEEFFFDTRIARIANTAPVPSSQGIKRAVVEEDVAEDDGGFGEVVADDSGEPEAAASFSTQVLQRVAGGNDIAAYIRLDLLLFDESIKFPAIK